jgi:peptidoglycan hydrolase-like protein with peptidoglycan-binding domain
VRLSDASQSKGEKKMKKLPLVILSLILLCGVTTIAQNSNSTTGPSASANKSKRGPIFRATAEQVKLAQALLKQRNFYSGEQTGKLSTETRAGLKEYQKAEGLKVTGTLNKTTLLKMGIELTDKQKTM